MMQSLREHLESPQFPDEEPLSVEDLPARGFNLAKFTGGWVAAGQPRWKAYTIFLVSILGGLLIALTGDFDSFDLLTLAGVAFAALGVFGIAETLSGKRLIRR